MHVHIIHMYTNFPAEVMVRVELAGWLGNEVSSLRACAVHAAVCIWRADTWDFIGFHDD